ncbi:MAG TPA: GNAT family N-acetyltransferase [Acidimicrobiia bacterium]|nr:GNAT family N-acetyltransferase [Acidimicrobiia bacterium]
MTSARTEDLSPAARGSIVDLCTLAHGQDDFRNLFSYVPSGGWHLLAYVDEELVSHALITTRWLQPEGHSQLKTAYVDAVATLPGQQRRGFGSMVMHRLQDEIDLDFEIACLETEVPSFYERLGWQLWRGPLACRTDEGLILTPDQRGIMVFSLSRTPDLNFAAGLTIERQGARIW